MRQNLGQKKVQALKRELNLPIIAVQVRGNTDHRKDLYLADGSIIYYWPKTGEQRISPFRHSE